MDLFSIDLLSQPMLWCIVQVTLVALLGWLLCTLVSRWTSPGAAMVPTVALAAVMVLTATAFVPWPNWWRFGPLWESAVSPVHLLELSAPIVKPSSVNKPLKLSDAEKVSPVANEIEPPAADVISKQRDTVAPSIVSERLWSLLPALPAGILACGAALGLLQLAGGLLSVRNIRKTSHPLHDADLLEWVDCLRAELRLQSDVPLRQCDRLTSAATVGWMRPVVLLPPAWREWTVEQRKAVLAHELAHVARGDFLACVLAQFSLALHFYHPLVHWLAARLRLEQELAADAMAAALAGGRKVYLQSLAELALHHSERSLGWPAHTFLPTQGTFLRRIEMLRDSKEAPTLGSGRGKAQRWGAVGLLIIGAILIAGLRGGPAPSPFDAVVQAQQPGVAAEGQKAGGIDLSYVNNDARLLVVVRPAEIIQVPEIKAVLDESAAAEKVKPFALLTLDSLDQIAFMGIPGVDGPIMVLQFSKPTTIETLTKAELIPVDAPEAKAGTNVEVPPHRQAYGVLNDRTLVLGPIDMVTRYLGSRRRGEPLIASGPAWEKVRKGAIAAALDMQLVREQLQRRPENAPEDAMTKALSAIAPLWADSEYLAAGILIEGKTAHVRAVATCQNAELAEHVAETAVAAKTLAQNLLRATRENERDIPAFAKFGIDTADGLLKSVKVERNEKLVYAQTSTDLPKVGTAAASNLIDAISQSRLAARRTISANNLKQIMLGMHNWADAAKGRFPPPVIMGKDGKGRFPHSWRVAILPYIDQAELYSQYNFDEPWDSETNKRVLAKMPAVFRDPADDPKSTTSAYYVLTGPKLLEETLVPGGGASPPEGGFPTAFSAKNGMPFSQITDGTSNTIAAVEAKAGIPWTKPEDIVFDPDKDLPKLGGITEGGFYIGLCDGSVRFLKSNVDPKILKLLIIPADGQPIPPE